jgi:hypothetical protein
MGGLEKAHGFYAVILTSDVAASVDTSSSLCTPNYNIHISAANIPYTHPSTSTCEYAQIAQAGWRKTGGVSRKT